MEHLLPSFPPTYGTISLRLYNDAGLLAYAPAADGEAWCSSSMCLLASSCSHCHCNWGIYSHSDSTGPLFLWVLRLCLTRAIPPTVSTLCYQHIKIELLKDFLMCIATSVNKSFTSMVIVKARHLCIARRLKIRLLM